MGFASRQEIAAALKAIDDAEKDGRFRDAAALLGQLLPKVRDDALHAAYRDRQARLEAKARSS
ncbi:MAG: hypothetical protein JOY81_11735 [Alphaproteobacteria bacterium]|nr:hypothetical protein [Alphaproteobacteria bacterium]